jgi:hypothetical protein
MTAGIGDCEYERTVSVPRRREMDAWCACVGLQCGREGVEKFYLYKPITCEASTDMPSSRVQCAISQPVGYIVTSGSGTVGDDAVITVEYAAPHLGCRISELWRRKNHRERHPNRRQAAHLLPNEEGVEEHLYFFLTWYWTRLPE